ncbi:hypothetical protein F0562_029965 [Nyssa sinensis]|uniref:Protein ABIL5 n=1 Tax=Nyssa sinensis TaxID=561372 RepID=A0A5J5AYZ9_9ASTE|nr:hypothetical protein F0562_029965 [Nyssa sinensis]
MEDSKTSVQQKIQNPEAESDDGSRFDNSLQELRDLCSQLHYAADYCETAFLNAKQKKAVMDNTREYIRRAVVTVVDHLGSVSDNLDYQLSNNNAISETGLRIDCLKQRFFTCQQYSQKLSLARQCLNKNLPRYHPRYISPPIPSPEKSNEVLRKSGSPIAARTSNKHEFEAEEEEPRKGIQMQLQYCLFAMACPVLPKATSPFQFEGNRKHRHSSVNWKAVQNSDIFALIRRSKRTR